MLAVTICLILLCVAMAVEFNVLARRLNKVARELEFKMYQLGEELKALRKDVDSVLSDGQ